LFFGFEKRKEKKKKKKIEQGLHDRKLWGCGVICKLCNTSFLIDGRLINQLIARV